MIQTEKEIKQAQIKALSKKLKEVLGFRFRGHSFELKDIIEAMKKENISVDSFSILIATDIHCAANITKYLNYKKLNPLVWFLFFGLEDQPTFTINFLYQLFFQETRILQAEKGIKLNIRYEGTSEKNHSESNWRSRIHNSERGKAFLGRGEGNKLRRIDE